MHAARLRVVLAALALAVGTLAALYGAWRGGEWALDRLLFANPSFEVRRLQIDSGGVLPGELVQAWAGVRRGANLLALDLGQVQRDLMLVPVVESAAVERVPPDTLRIRVKARLPVAEVGVPRLPAGGGIELVSYYLDAQGWVIRILSEEQGELLRLLVPNALPRLVGVDTGLLHAGRRVVSPEIQAALALIEGFEGSPMSGLTGLVSVDVAARGAVEATTTEGSRITFGLSEVNGQLARWRDVHDYAAARGKTIVTLDLSVRGNVPAVFADSVVPGTETPRPVPQPVTTRKRHV
jgi:cell division septal protein FtsQ